MHTVTIHEAKTHLSRLIQECQLGDDVIIAKGKEPVARLTAIQPTATPRHLGGARGLVTQITDDFDAPLADFGEYQP